MNSKTVAFIIISILFSFKFPSIVFSQQKIRKNSNLLIEKVPVFIEIKEVGYGKQGVCLSNENLYFYSKKIDSLKYSINVVISKSSLKGENLDTTFVLNEKQIGVFNYFEVDVKKGISTYNYKPAGWRAKYTIYYLGKVKTFFMPNYYSLYYAMTSTKTRLNLNTTKF